MNDKVSTSSAGSDERLDGINPQVVGAIEVRLDAYLGSARMTVAALSALRKGEVITLDAALNAAVQLRLNGVVVARGELVAVDDHFAVKLSEIAA